MNKDVIEELREELYETINNSKCLCNKNVIEISERLNKIMYPDNKVPELV